MKKIGCAIMLLSVGAVLLAIWTPWIWQALLTAVVLFVVGAALFGWNDQTTRTSEDVWTYGRRKPGQ